MRINRRFVQGLRRRGSGEQGNWPLCQEALVVEAGLGEEDEGGGGSLNPFPKSAKKYKITVGLQPEGEESFVGTHMGFRSPEKNCSLLVFNGDILLKEFPAGSWKTAQSEKVFV